MAELSRKEMSKIICKHLRKDSLVDGVSETYLIASVMDALKEIKEQTTTEAEIRASAIDEFAEKLCDVFSEKYGEVTVNGIKFDVLTLDGATEITWEVAEQLKEE